jgi:hypothetical protein
MIQDLRERDLFMHKILEVKALPGYKLWLRYADGIEGTVDLSGLVGRGVFAPWKDTREFERVRLTEYGAPAWGDLVDLCPDALYLEITGQQPQEIFPSLRRASSDA